jgi:hypothetical protein
MNKNDRHCFLYWRVSNPHLVQHFLAAIITTNGDGGDDDGGGDGGGDGGDDGGDDRDVF